MFCTFQNLSFTNSIANYLFRKSCASTDKIEILNLSKDSFLLPLQKIPITSITPRETMLFFILNTRASHQQKIVFCFNGGIRTRIIKRNIQ